MIPGRWLPTGREIAWHEAYQPSALCIAGIVPKCVRSDWPSDCAAGSVEIDWGPGGYRDPARAKEVLVAVVAGALTEGGERRVPTQAEQDQMLFDLVIDKLGGHAAAPAAEPAVPTNAELRDQARELGLPRPPATAGNSRMVPRRPVPAADEQAMTDKGRVHSQHHTPADRDVAHGKTQRPGNDPNMTADANGGGDLDAEAVAELRRLARSRPRSGREAVAKASALRALERLNRAKRPVPPMPERWYPYEPGHPYYELDWVFLHEHPAILQRHWELAWREGRV